MSLFAGGGAGRAERTHRSALVVIPPEAAWEPIQAIRRIHDRKIDRWMPHLTLLYPFRPKEAFGEAAAEVEAACAAIAPFPVTLATFRSFDHGRGSFTMWLDPEPGDPLRSLHGALLARFPDCADASSFAGGFRPHLSVGQMHGSRETGEALSALQRRWSPLAFEIAEVALAARDEHGPFRVERTVRLGGGAGGGGGSPSPPALRTP